MEVHNLENNETVLFYKVLLLNAERWTGVRNKILWFFPNTQDFKEEFVAQLIADTNSNYIWNRRRKKKLNSKVLD
jgi:hypothetical protein